MDDQAEVDFINRAQIAIGVKRSFWIGGSTDAPHRSLICLNSYQVGDSGKLIVQCI